MRTLILLLCVQGATWVHAQEEVPAAPEPSTCLMATTEEVWSQMGAGVDQVDQLRALQPRCHADCTTEDGTRKEVRLTGAIIRKYEDDVARILSPEQFTKWKTWCTDRPVRM